MGRPHISARSKKQTIVTKHDAIENRKRALFHFFKNPTKAERAFDAEMDKGKNCKITEKDFATVNALLDTYFELQEQIEDETNADAQMQRAYIDQQHDILDDLELIYKKYLPNGTTSKMHNK